MIASEMHNSAYYLRSMFLRLSFWVYFRTKKANDGEYLIVTKFFGDQFTDNLIYCMYEFNTVL